ncbi:MAG: dTDP-glucose 4,6-dehydratase [Planctomycetota bacterium]
MRLLVTGGCGFIGSNFIRFVLAERPDVRVVNLDALTYAAHPGNLEGVDRDPRYRFVHGSIVDEDRVDRLMGEGVDAVVHFAAESHVDRSLYGPVEFVRTNVQGTLTLLETARRHGVGRFVQVSTDEVYGSLPAQGRFTEETPLHPNNPYAATKAAADLMAGAYAHTFGLPVVVTRSSNNYGPRQHPEKLIPLCIANAMEDRELPVYGDGLQVRDWLYVEDHCRGILAALERGRPGEVYNFGGGDERTNLEVVRAILRRVGKPDSLIRLVQDRPGHDRRYAIDFSKARRELGWSPQVPFEEGLARTVAWYRENSGWMARARDEEYRRFYEKHYGAR